MATLTWYGTTGYNLALIEFGYLSVASTVTRAPTKYVIKYPYGTTDTFKGTDLTYKGAELAKGTITSFVGVEEGRKQFELTGVSLKASHVKIAARDSSIAYDQNLLKRALSGNDTIKGGLGDDAIEGFGGSDVLYGNRGADLLFGGSGRDTFLYKSRFDTGVTPDTADIIMDFKAKQDRIDLSPIDANSKVKGNQAFKFIGQKNFTKHAGELRFEAFPSETFISGDVTGDGKADFLIILEDRINMKQDYFVL